MTWEVEHLVPKKKKPRGAIALLGFLLVIGLPTIGLFLLFLYLF